jgi:hypothetical protein
MKVSATKGAVLLVLMKENLQNKNLIAILLASLYNDIQVFLRLGIIRTID